MNGGKGIHSRLQGRFGPGARIIAAVLVMGVALVAALLPLMRGLDQNVRMEQEVSEVLLPESIRVTTLVSSLLEAQSGIERYLVTLDGGDRERFDHALEMARITLAGLSAANLYSDPETERRRITVIDGVSSLIDKLERQAFHLFEQSRKPDNVSAVHLINTSGEQLRDRTSELVDLIMDRWMQVDPAGDPLVLSALMGYQDSTSRMMSALRGYLFMKDEGFKQRYLDQRQRNEWIFETVQQKLSGRDVALTSRVQTLNITRDRLVEVMDRAVRQRESAGWRRDFEYYRSEVAPTLESLKWVLQTLSDSSSQGISRVIEDTTRFGMSLKERTMISVAVLLGAGLLLALWIYRWVGVFNRQIGGAVVSLGRLSARMRRETEGQALAARNQVEEIGGVYNNLNDLEASLSRIREQTEKMALQTDSASLECVQGMEVLAYSQDRMAAILQQVREISHAMELTKSQTGRMDGILAILNELVDQTKLLSFNATIEAAGAGESGARFAVVAKQVRHLATRAREATQDIHEMIRRVQANAEETRAATERGTAAVNEGENLMQVVTERLDLIVGAVSEVSDLAGGVFLATQAQTKSLSRVNRFVGEARETAEQVDRQSQGTLVTAAELNQTAQGLSHLLGRRTDATETAPPAEPQATPPAPPSVAPESGPAGPSAEWPDAVATPEPVSPESPVPEPVADPPEADSREDAVEAGADTGGGLMDMPEPDPPVEPGAPSGADPRD